MYSDFSEQNPRRRDVGERVILGAQGKKVLMQEQSRVSVVRDEFAEAIGDSFMNFIEE